MRAAPALLEVVPLGPVEERTGRWLGERLAERLGTRVVLAPALALHPAWRTDDGACYDSNRIVDALIDRLGAAGASADDRWSLGLTEVDLCAPGRAFVFGEATLGGCCAVISLARLRPAAARDAVDPARLRSRVLKEALHEIGHIAGLGHCADPACLMAEAGDVAAIDRRSHAFCAACSRP